MLRSKSLSLQLKVDQVLAARHPYPVWLRWYQYAKIRAATFQWTQGFAILLGVLFGWLMFYVARGLSDSAQWNLLNNPGNIQWFFPANLPPIRSVLFVASLLQLALTYWIVAWIPAWQHLQEKPIGALDTKALGDDIYYRLPISGRAAVSMFCNEMPWRFVILLVKSTITIFYVFLFLAYDGRLAVTPLLLGIGTGGLQAWLVFHLWVGIWTWEDWLLNSTTTLGRLYRFYLHGGDALWITLTAVAVFAAPAGWWAWLLPLPPLILDPQHPQATFSVFSGQIYYLTMTLQPTGWLNLSIEAMFEKQLWLGYLGLIPLLALAVAHWKFGMIVWPLNHLTRGRLSLNPESNAEDELLTTSDIRSDEPLDNGGRRLEVVMRRTPPEATQLLNRDLFVESKMPDGGCGPFDSAGAELARKVLFPQTNALERMVAGGSSVRLPFSRYYWYIFPGLLLFQLVFSRIQGRPADLLYVIGIIAVHGLVTLVPPVLFGLPEGHRTLLRLPVHADWLIALWVQSSWRWCARWLGILAISWVPLLQWFDRVGLLGIGMRLLTVVLLMNWVVAGAIFFRSLPCWNELATAQRSGFFDLRPNSLLRELYLTIGTLIWVATHIAVVLEIAFAAPLWLIGLQIAFSSCCSWYLLYGLKQTNLYPS